MKSLLLVLLTILVVATCEPPASKRSHHYSHWPPKIAKHSTSPKTKTLMVQIRSDHPVPFIFKGRPGATRTHGQFMQTAHGHSQVMPRRPRPVKQSSPMYLKSSHLQSLRQPLKIKLSNFKLHSKPTSANYEKPYKYEKPSTVSYMQLDLPSTTKANFISEHFAPIHTIPAPNLALHDNHIHQHEELHSSSPKPQPYHPTPSSNKNFNNHLDHQYEVLEDITNDATFIDPISDSQKLFAPDPDPSLPTSKVRPATEPYNRPSNGKPYPGDVRNNLLLPVQIIGAEQAKLTAAEAFPQQGSAQLQPFISPHLTAIQAAPLSNYDPTYLVTQSNNLYSQHKQQLFQPHFPIQSIQGGYANADLTQEVASDGQILQAAKPHHRTKPTTDSLPQFAALIAAPALSDAYSSTAAVAPFHLPNAAIPDTQGGFVISNYYNNPVQDSSQLLHAYAEEEAQAEANLAEIELQKQQQIQHQQNQQQLQLEQQHQQQLQLQEQHERQQELQQFQQIHDAERANNQFKSQQLIQEQSPQHFDAPASAFEEHQRLVQQQLGSNTPLRIFVPDDDESRLQKRAETRSAQVDSSPHDNEESQ